MSQPTHLMRRLFDLMIAFFGLIILSPIFVLLFFIGLLSSHSPLFFQKRVGRFQKPFSLIKFRTMRVGTLSLATHLVDSSAVTPFGGFLRKTKLDEFPQLWNVLKGEMSLVGPRPCLFNQKALIKERAKLNVFKALPGITGLAQISGIDMSKPKLLAETDAQMLKELNLRMYFNCIWITVMGKRIDVRVKISDQKSK